MSTPHRRFKDAIYEQLAYCRGPYCVSACGAGMSGKPSSTIAFERRWNELLSKPRAEFVEAILDVPPKPAEMAQILLVNQGRQPTP